MGVLLLAVWFRSRGRARGKVEDPNAPAQRCPLPPDNKVGRYTIEEVIADGGTATVYRARSDDGHTVALKIPHSDHLGSKEFVATFYNEASIGETLRHPSIVTVLEVGKFKAGPYKNIPYFAMEFLEGQDLRTTIRQQGRLPAKEAAKIARGIADALGWAHHRGVIHRDVSPRNIFITRQKTVKVMDFGISTVFSRVDRTRSKALTLGTPEYLAPERIDDPRSADQRGDLYSLGCIMYEMLTGKPPFHGDDPVDLLNRARKRPVPPIPQDIQMIPGLWPIIARLLEKDPRKRFQSAGEVTSALADLASAV